MALTLTFLAWSWASSHEGKPTQIEEELVTAAIRLWRDYFWPHAKAALRQVGLSEKHANARRVLRWIRSTHKPGELLSLKDIRRDALSQSIDAEQTERLLEDLERAGWLRRETTPTAGRARHRWQVNEQLFSFILMHKVQEVQEAPTDGKPDPFCTSCTSCITGAATRGAA